MFKSLSLQIPEFRGVRGAEAFTKYLNAGADFVPAESAAPEGRTKVANYYYFQLVKKYLQLSLLFPPSAHIQNYRLK
jgi:hypothetical protein